MRLREDKLFPRLSQEGLKTVACVTMLLDHIGATLVAELYVRTAATGVYSLELYRLYNLLRTVGRLAFPIFCFLLVEGFHHTRNPKKYILRLAVFTVVSELPFDLVLHEGLGWGNQNVMLTLLLGFLALSAMSRTKRIPLKLLIAVPFAFAAECLRTDYGAEGIWVIVLFALTREEKYRTLLQFFGLWFIFSPDHLMLLNWLSGEKIIIQELAILSVIPLALYTGEKKSRSRYMQLGFYLFYPVHLALLWLLQKAIYV